MKMEPIEIDIEDLKKFAHAAFILDRPQVQKEMDKLRTLWHLRKLIPYNKFESWLEEPHYDFNLSKDTANLDIQVQEQIEDDEAKDNYDEAERFRRNKKYAYMNPMDLELEYLLKRLGYNSSYKRLILRGIVCGKVTENDLLSKSKEFEYGEFLDMAMLDQVIEKAYDNDTKPEIKRDRVWYWKKQFGKSYLQIAREAPKSEKGNVDPHDFRDAVKKQVQRYKTDFLGGDI